MEAIDIATIRACQEGDRAAALRIYDALSDKVFRLAHRYTHDSDRAMDLSQEVFLRVFSRIGTFRAASSLETWVYRVAVNTIVGQLRAERVLDQLPEETTLPSSAATPERRVTSAELSERIAIAIANLPESQRIAFILVAVEHLPYSEVAALLGLSVEAVRMRMSRARSRLRRMLHPYLTGGDQDDV